MIQIRIEELVNAAGAKALERFFACGLSLPAWKSLRHLGAACDRELKLFQTKRDELMAKHAGKPMTNGGVEFADAEAAKTFAAEWQDLMALDIELPGNPIKLDDLQSGSLTAGDHVLLKSFFAADLHPEKLD